MAETDILVGIMHSPEGRATVGMTLEGKEWLLLAVKRTVTVSKAAEQLRRTLGIDSILGVAFDLAAAAEREELKLAVDPQADEFPSLRIAGLYVPAESFDRLAASIVDPFTIS